MHIIDMNNVLLPYCFAIPERFSPDGIQVNGLYGFCRFIKKNFKHHIICAADKCSNNFRKSLDSNYKKNRPPLDSKIYKQINLLETLCNDVNINVISHENYEADDIIATLVSQYPEKHTVYSTDKDLLQLCVYDNVNLLHPFTNKKSTGETIRTKYNVEPQEFTMFLALMGDAADNIPGIMGVGPKTAAKIIKEGAEKYKSKFDFSPLEHMITMVKLHNTVPINLEPKSIDFNIWNNKMELLGFTDLIHF